MAAVLPDQPARPENARQRPFSRKPVRWLLLALIIAIAAFFGFRYWADSRAYASTENAYVNTDRAEIAALVSGPVLKIHAAENQVVKAGQPLFDIDPRSYEVALEKARAQLQLATQSVSQQNAAIAAAEAQVAQREAELRNAQANFQRTERLKKQGFLSEQGGEAAATQVATATATLHAAQANLEQARSALGQTGSDNANVQVAQAAIEQAELDLKRTHVAAPADGVVTNMNLRPGEIVQPGVPLFVVVNNDHYWVDANFKETETQQIRPGEQASVEVDMYPGKTFHGVVESLSSGSGTAFSLLPPQNATGNWVKVTQRVPVRVRITDPDPRYPLRVGTTASVKVSLRSGESATSGR
ncbi:HlyD family secretion protein [Noviherbaspirillum galbum]|uniref:HlyD family secretion protein n=1 Tax=Noviherbaspirillum galbum TaxID=2709383 RepID=A0A6B3SRK9_9BURK|nr:HlyD family secretion protein [Noviherbaspirillum galbum]NEX63281.1 HlyD family secretion protein [Noviherbaspirillum galbum]